MLSFDIRSLESRAAHVDGTVSPDDSVWEAGDMRPATPIHVEGRLSAAGPGRFYFSGRMSGTSEMPCRRCLEDVRVEVSEDEHFIFSAAAEEETDDPDVFPFDPQAHQLDMRPAVREAWLLAAPAFVQCREDCKGLCPTCGTDWNVADCDCEPVTIDSRWEKLRAIRDDLS
ncbi:MAG: DUF177 domain-containing protein [Gemmatimonadota bacterium]|nr:DUF177 domain-containing protein [Gemmatimonadota bacterium]